MRPYLFSAFVFLMMAAKASAQDVTLRVHHFMGERAVLHSQLLVNWASELQEKSDGRIAVELFAAMSLGGAPGDLYDQASDGAADIILTLPGYTPGRFEQVEVFELPFMMKDPVATSKALWDMIDTQLQDSEFSETQILSAWTHGPGVIHSKTPLRSLEDLAGVELRGPTRLATDLIGELGATPVGMPLPAIPENLSKGVISATFLPWEITPAIRLSELVPYHTELAGERALYTATFVLAMNIDAYEALPDDLRAIIDKTTGKIMAERAAQIEIEADRVGRAVAQENGNTIFVLDQGEVARWVQAAQPVYDRFIERAHQNGIDGQALINQARALIAANE